MRVLVVFLMLLFAASAGAEYRVYRLGIKYHPENKNEKEIEIISNFDDLQYESYFRLTSTQQTRIIKHWMCWGRTDYQIPYCAEPKPSPQDKSLDIRSPAQDTPQQPASNVIK